MKKTLILLPLFITFITLAGCSTTKNRENSPLNIAVSIQPEAAFVEAVLGDKGTVTTVIPPGFSPANYQPSPKELAKVSDADLYFSIGVSAEKNILPKIVGHKTRVILLSEAVEKEYPLLHLEEHSHNNEAETNKSHDEESGTNEYDEGVDPHIWMSPKRAMVMIETIQNSLSDIDPENTDYYATNAISYLKKLEILDLYIIETLSNSELQSFIIYHPSLGYLANDYGLTMMVIEEDGKAATIETITSVIDFAKENSIKVIFYQEEFDSKQAKVIADEIGGSVIALDILSKDYMNNMRKIIDTFTANY